MQYIKYYESKMGRILLAADDRGLTGIWFDGQKFFADKLVSEIEEKNTEVLEKTVRWLDIYFGGKKPDFFPEIHLTGTDFQMEVWRILQEIPYGKVVTYGDIASKIAMKRGIKRMSAQAIGGAVGHNPIAIVVPCHRVVGSDGTLTGYAGGSEKKAWLLSLEGVGTEKELILSKRTVL